MSTETIISVVLPLALAVTMFGLGLRLTIQDFTRLFKMPRVILIGLFCQIILLPVLALALATVFGLSPVLGMGLMILAAAPGGPTANLMSHFAGGNVALNVTLTALNSLTAIVTLPILIQYAYAHFFGEAATVPAESARIVQVLLVVTVPMVLAMWLHASAPLVAAKMRQPINIFSIVFLLVIVIGTVSKERELILGGIGPVGLAVLLFNLGSMAVGFFIPRALKVSHNDSIAIAMEVGIHNGTLAIAIASSPGMMNSMAMAVPAALYTLVMYMTGAIWIQFLKRQKFKH